MKILIRQAILADPASPKNGQVSDILVSDGIISRIAPSIDEKADEIVEGQSLVAAPGFTDIFSHFTDPGFEHRETLASGSAAATAGGYTRVFTLPNTMPVTDSKSQIEYISRADAGLPVTLHPLGAITRGAEGKTLAEMYDMRNSGAVAFTDGTIPVQSPGIFLKALQYVRAFGGILVQVPLDNTIGAGGLINEGIISTRLGLPGLPSLSEEIMIKRDIDLLRYTQSKLHLTGVSTQKGFELIADAKKEGLGISCSVTPYHLFFCDEDLQTYDTNLKVNPPLRSRADMMAAREAVASGVVDCIASHHIPQNWDDKTCEFEYAKNGMISLQTCFAAVHHVMPEMEDARLVALLSVNARKLFGLEKPSISEGAVAECTLFTRAGKTLLSRENNRSKSINSPFAGRELNGKIVGTIHKGKLTLNQPN